MRNKHYPLLGKSSISERAVARLNLVTELELASKGHSRIVSSLLSEDRSSYSFKSAVFSILFRIPDDVRNLKAQKFRMLYTIVRVRVTLRRRSTTSQFVLASDLLWLTTSLF
jgi:hypothetical protein